MVQRGQREGDLRTDLDPLVGAASVLGVLDMNLAGMLTGLLTAPQPSEEELARMKRQVVEAALGAVLAPGGPAPAR
jgi:hypothetical protein